VAERSGRQSRRSAACSRRAGAVDLAHADQAVAAWLVLDDEHAAELVLQQLRDQPPMMSATPSGAKATTSFTVRDG
jgi:hypothetical protein